jgi:hypothetical protein
VESQAFTAYAGPFTRADRYRWPGPAFAADSGLQKNYRKVACVEWQRNFFDHRLRHDESLAEKFAYICQNPVRAGLIRNARGWPYVFIPDSEFRR